MEEGKLPRHIAIIPDGNRRWAKSKALELWKGHQEGEHTFRKISQKSFGIGIRYFTFWAASEDNLTKRDPLEIAYLTFLLQAALNGDMVGMLFKEQIRFRVVGRWEEIFYEQGRSNPELSKSIKMLEEKTSLFSSSGKNLTVLFGYSGKAEMTEAVKEFWSNSYSLEDINFELLKEFSWTSFLPPVDLEIRTGEERPGFSHRSAGFLPFLTTDSVTYATKTFWPDFSEEEFVDVLDKYSSFERRFGA